MPLAPCGFFTGSDAPSVCGSLSLECILKAALPPEARRKCFGGCVCAKHAPEVLQRRAKLCAFVSIFPARSQVPLRRGIHLSFSAAEGRLSVLAEWARRADPLLMSSGSRNSSTDEEIENPCWSVRALVQQYEGQQRSPSESSCSR